MGVFIVWCTFELILMERWGVLSVRKATECAVVKDTLQADAKEICDHVEIVMSEVNFRERDCAKRKKFKDLNEVRLGVVRHGRCKVVSTSTLIQLK